MVQNIANFCCTENIKYNTSLNFSFTFGLLKEPPSMLFFLRIKMLHSMLKVPGVVQPYWALFFVSYSSAIEEIVQPFIAALNKKCQRFRSLLQVINCDGEESFITAGCATFPAAAMLLYSNHAKQNIKKS